MNKRWLTITAKEVRIATRVLAKGLVELSKTDAARKQKRLPHFNLIFLTKQPQ